MTVSKTSEPQVILNEAIGRDAIPLDFAGLEGSVEKDTCCHLMARRDVW